MLRKKILLVGNPSLRRIKFLKFDILGDHQNKMSLQKMRQKKVPKLGVVRSQLKSRATCDVIKRKRGNIFNCRFSFSFCHNR